MIDWKPNTRIRIMEIGYIWPWRKGTEWDAMVEASGRFRLKEQDAEATWSINQADVEVIPFTKADADALMAKATTKPTNPKDAIGSTKLPWHVLPLVVLAGVVLAFLGGALKYGSHNYRKAGVRASVYIDGAMRHIVRFAEGEDWDPDVVGYDKGVRIHHIDEAIAGLMVLRDSIIRKNWTDDRAPFSDPVWIDEANRMSALIISCNPNPVAPVTQASLNSAPASLPQADTEEPTPPTPFVPTHDTEPGSLLSPAPEEALPPILEAIPEGVTRSSSVYNDAAFLRGDVSIDGEGSPTGLDHTHPLSFWYRWKDRFEDFPLSVLAKYQ